MPTLLQVAPKDISGYLKDNGWIETCPPLPPIYAHFSECYDKGYWQHPVNKDIFYSEGDKCFMMMHPKGNKWGHVQAFNIIKIGDMRLGDWRYTGDSFVSDCGLVHINLK